MSLEWLNGNDRTEAVVFCGTTQRVLRYESLGPVSRREASDILSQRLVEAGRAPARSRVTFETLANQWQATVVPMYKPSTQKNHRHILTRHLMPRFGEKSVADVTRQEIQAYVAHLAHSGYGPESIDLYEGAFGTPTTSAGLRRVPLSEATVTPLGVPACATLNLPNATWLTFRRTYGRGLTTRACRARWSRS